MRFVKIIIFFIIFNISFSIKTIEFTDKEKSFIKKHQTITLGLDEIFESLMEKYDEQHKGNILKTIEKESGLEINLIYDNLSNLVEKSEKREIDGLVGSSFDQKKSTYLNFTEAYISVNNIVVIKKGNPAQIYSFSDLENKKAAVQEGNAYYQELTKRFKDTGIIYYRDKLTAVKSVISEETDFFIADESITYIAAKKGLGNFIEPVLTFNETFDVAFALRNDWPELKSIFNKVILSLSEEEKEQMKSTWFNILFGNPDNIDINNMFSTEEKEFLRKKGKIKYSVIPTWHPFEWIDENGKHKGAGNDILRLITEKTDLEFELIPTKTWKKSLENIKNREADILFMATETKSRKDYMNFTVPYIKEPLVIATKKKEFFVKDLKDIGQKKIGIVRNYAHKEILLTKYPNLNIIDVENPADGLNRVHQGELFGYLDSMPVIAYNLNKYSIYNLKVAGKFDFYLKQSIASRNDEPLLNSIMQKVLNSLSDEEKNEIIDKWISINYEPGFDYRIFWSGLTVILIIIIFLIIQNISSKNFNKKLSKLNLEIEEHLNTEQRQKAVAIKLNKVFAEIISSKDLDKVLELITKSILDIVNCHKVDVFIREGDNYVVVASGGRKEKESVVGTIIPKDNVFYSEEFHSKKEIIYIENLQNIDAVKYGHDVNEIKSMILIPLKSKDTIIGMMSINHNKITKFTNEDMEIIETLTQNAVIAIINAKNYAEIETLLRNEEKQKNIAIKVNELFNEITSARELDVIMKLIINSLLELIEVAVIDIFMVEEDHLKIIANGGSFAKKENIGLEIPKDKFFFFDEIQETKNIKYIHNLQNMSGEKYGKGIEEIKSFIIVPLVFNDKIIGVININSKKENRFSKENIEVAKLFARNAVIAMINAKNYKEIKKQNDSLREANERMQLTIDGANLIPIVWNIKDDKITLGSSIELPKNFASTLKSYLDSIHIDDRSRVIKAIDNHLKGESEFFNEEFRIKIIRNNYIWVNSILKIMEKDENGKPVRMFGINQDITERKNVESQIIRSEKMAALGQLVASVAHEINTPIGAIKSSAENIKTSLKESFNSLPDLLILLTQEEKELYLSMISTGIESNIFVTTKELREKKRAIKKYLAEQNIDDSRTLADNFVSLGILKISDIDRYLSLCTSQNRELIFNTGYNLVSSIKSTDIIENSVKSASKIVYALRSYARFNSEENKREVNIKESLETVLVIYHNKIKYDIELIREYDDNLKNIPAFGDELNQVWTNLIHNALQAMHYSGTLKLQIRQDNNSQTVSISDTGNGIPERVKAKIFEPFFTTKPEGEGTGLGLGIVKKIIDKHKGEIWFESKEGVGTTFFVKLPLEKE